MEVKQNQANNYSNSGGNSAGEQLNKVLDNPNGIEDSGVKNQEVEKKIFLQKGEAVASQVKTKKKLFKDLGWYWDIIRRPVKILAGLEILVSFLSSFDSLRSLMLNVVDPLLLLVILIFFGWVIWQVRIKKEESFWQAIVTVFIAGFVLGLVSSVFKAVWIREYWTIFNLTTEPVFMGLVGVVVGLIVGLVVRKK